MMKSSLCIVTFACLLLSGCVNVTSWTSTPITMSDGFVTELRVRSIEQGMSSPAEDAYIVMPDGALIKCFLDCRETYEANKAKHQPSKKPEQKIREVEGD